MYFQLSKEKLLPQKESFLLDNFIILYYFVLLEHYHF